MSKKLITFLLSTVITSQVGMFSNVFAKHDDEYESPSLTSGIYFNMDLFKVPNNGYSTTSLSYRQKCTIINEYNHFIKYLSKKFPNKITYSPLPVGSPYKVNASMKKIIYNQGTLVRNWYSLCNYMKNNAICRTEILDFINNNTIYLTKFLNNLEMSNTFSTTKNENTQEVIENRESIKPLGYNEPTPKNNVSQPAQEQDPVYLGLIKYISELTEEQQNTFIDEYNDTITYINNLHVVSNSGPLPYLHDIEKLPSQWKNMWDTITSKYNLFMPKIISFILNNTKYVKEYYINAEQNSSDNSDSGDDDIDNFFIQKKTVIPFNTNKVNKNRSNSYVNNSKNDLKPTSILDFPMPYRDLNKVRNDNLLHTKDPTHVLDIMNNIDLKIYDNTITTLCNNVIPLLQKDSNLLRLNGEVIVVGDIHGDFIPLYYSVQKFLNKLERGENPYILFLGDYVDRGPNSVKNIATLFKLKTLLPQNVFLLRGNHEDITINSRFGLLNELSRCKVNLIPLTPNDIFFSNLLKGNPLIQTINKAFNYLPVSAIINNSIFCVHGGISKDMTINDIENIPRPMDGIDIINNELMSNLLWSDPTLNNQLDDTKNTNRGIGVFYGEESINTFLNNNNLNLIIRAHEYIPTGYRINEFRNGYVVTLFSAPDYMCQDNKGAIAIIDKFNNIDFKIIP